MERFELGDQVYCIKEYKTLKIGSNYHIKGSGDLRWNADKEVGNRTGYGYCIEDQFYGSFSGKKNWHKLPHSERIKWYYFTEKEMCDYFITDEQNRRAYIRNIKIDRILNI